jgi:hypothetical protein
MGRFLKDVCVFLRLTSDLTGSFVGVFSLQHLTSYHCALNGLLS